MNIGQLLLGKRPFLIALMLLVLAGYCGYFYYAMNETELLLLREQSWEKHQDES